MKKQTKLLLLALIAAFSLGSSPIMAAGQEVDQGILIENNTSNTYVLNTEKSKGYLHLKQEGQEIPSRSKGHSIILWSWYQPPFFVGETSVKLSDKANPSNSAVIFTTINDRGMMTSKLDGSPHGINIKKKTDFIYTIDN